LRAKIEFESQEKEPSGILDGRWFWFREVVRNENEYEKAEEMNRKKKKAFDVYNYSAYAELGRIYRKAVKK